MWSPRGAVWQSAPVNQAVQLGTLQDRAEAVEGNQLAEDGEVICPAQGIVEQVPTTSLQVVGARGASICLALA